MNDTDIREKINGDRNKRHICSNNAEFSEINDSHQTTDPRSLENDQSNKYQKKSTQNTLISKLLKLKTRRKS
jgi:hypothetical protein